MIPPKILQVAVERQLDVIGITDHNTAENVAAVRSAAEGTGIRVIGGMEVTSVEEVHVLALFDEDVELEEFQSYVYAHLHGTNDPETFGHQWVVDGEGDVVDVNPRLLIGATTVPLAEVVERIHAFGGVAIAAHIDRPSYSVVSQLGFIPADLALDGVELSPFARQNGFDEKALEMAGGQSVASVTFSDAHYLEEMGRAFTDLIVADGSVAELRLALHRKAGRSVCGGR